MGRRRDGYHDLFSLFQMIDLGDELIFQALPEGITLEGEGENLPDIKDNLVFRAAMLLQRECEPSQGVRIVLKKLIPISGGLGGGSSNAAATLLGLTQLWDLDLSRRDLKRLGEKLGADVPFFFDGPLALVGGKGERVFPLASRQTWGVLLVNPSIFISTRWVYQNLKDQRGKDQKDFTVPSGSLGTLKKWLTRAQEQFNINDFGRNPPSFPDILASLHNDLEPVVVKRYPVIQKIKEDLTAHGALLSLMSGSGSTVFGIFDDTERMKAAERALKPGKGWFIRKAQTLSHSPWANILSALKA